MDLDKLNAVDTKNPAAVKELQEFLKTRGYYTGPIDGKWGGGTTEGAGKLRTDLMETAKTARDTAVANQETNSPLNNALRGVTEFGPYAGGAALGAWAGHKGAKGMSSRWDRDAAQTKALASDPKISGVAGEAKMSSMRGARNAITGSQFLAPAALLGSAEYIRGHIAPKFEGETQKWINLGANADQGAGLGLAAHQLFDLKNRIASPADAADEARIETRAAAERNPAAPATTRPNSERLIAAAKAAGATGKLTKATAAEYLAKNVTDANRAAVAAELGVTKGQQVASTVKKLLAKPGASMIVAPLIGASVAYDAASGEAEAAGATPGEARTQGAVAGTGAAGLTAGAGYSLSKLLAKAPELGKALGRMSGPMLLNDLATQGHQAAFGAGPRWLDVPERNPNRSVITGQDSGPMMQAAALQVPQGVPLPNPDGSSPYPEMAPMGAGPMLPQQPQMPMRRPQLPYAAMGFGGRY